MGSGNSRDTLRVPPQVDGPAGRLAQQMRNAPLCMDEVRQARIERSLVQAWRTGGAAKVPLPRLGPSRRERRTRVGFIWAASVSVAAVAGALLSVNMDAPREGELADARVGHFELRIADGSVHSGSVAEGQTLEVGKHGLMQVDLGASRIDLSRETRVRFERLSPEDLHLNLSNGRLEVAFHPSERGEQRMLVRTEAATVLVVGTVFSVEADARGNTEVAVSEGVVEVRPRAGGEVRRVAAGERTEVRMDAGDALEQRLRAAIADQMLEAESEDARTATGDDVYDDADVFDMDLSDRVRPQPRRQRPLKATGRLAVSGRLEAARELLRQGKHTAARRQLRTIVGGEAHKRDRVEAMTLIAESYTAQGYIPRATEAYRRAARIAPNHPSGHNALFALARLLDRYTVDRAAAIKAYRAYLTAAPKGVLSPQAKSALCRLGKTDHCDG